MSQLIKQLAEMFPTNQLLLEDTRLAAYGRDASLICGDTPLVILAEGVQDVCRAVRFCHMHGMPYLARGRATGYTGGCVPQNGSVIISLERWRGVEWLDVLAQEVTVAPGTTIGEINAACQPAGLFFPPDPVSKDHCTIGGAVNENSSGPRCFMYGPTHQFVSRLEFISASGEMMMIQKGGGGEWDRRFWSLFGSEGTLGVVGRVTCRLVKSPRYTSLIRIEFDNDALIADIQHRLYDSRIDFAAMEMITPAYCPDVGRLGPYILYLETSSEDAATLGHITSDIKDMMHRFPVSIRINDGDLYLRRGEGYRECRSRISQSLEVSSISQLVDGVVPRVALADIVRDLFVVAEQHQLPMLHTFHFSDGNIHPTFFYPRVQDIEERQHAVLSTVMDLCLSYGGSLAGEHGIGVEKREFLGAAHSPEEISAFRSLKTLADADGLLNQEKILGGSSLLPHRLYNLSESPHVILDPLQLTVSCDARTPWFELVFRVQSEGFAIPIEIPGLCEHTTVQDVLCGEGPNLHGLRYGEPLDQLLCTEYGSTIGLEKTHVCGRLLVKNVSGYCIHRSVQPPVPSWTPIRHGLRIALPLRSTPFEVRLPYLNLNDITAVARISPDYYLWVCYDEGVFVVVGRTSLLPSSAERYLSKHLKSFEYRVLEEEDMTHRLIFPWSRRKMFSQSIASAYDTLISGQVDIWCPQRQEVFSRGSK